MSFIYPEKMVAFIGLFAFSTTVEVEEPHFGVIADLKTDYKHVEWYNLFINPALDYGFTYKNMHFLFFDWHEKERILRLFKSKDKVSSLLKNLESTSSREELKSIVDKIQDIFSSIDPEMFNTPWAENVLTDGGKQDPSNQKKMLEDTINQIKKGANKGEKILVISMHPTVFCEPGKTYTNGQVVDDKDLDDDEPKHLALGTFRKHRHWLIEQLWNLVTDQKGKAKVIVLSGHAHKNRVYTIKIDEEEKESKGEERRAKKKEGKVFNLEKNNKKLDLIKMGLVKKPLFFIVTTTSAFLSEEKNTPGFRILTFDKSGLYTELEPINKNKKI